MAKKKKEVYVRSFHDVESVRSYIGKHLGSVQKLENDLINDGFKIERLNFFIHSPGFRRLKKSERDRILALSNELTTIMNNKYDSDSKTRSKAISEVQKAIDSFVKDTEIDLNSINYKSK